MAASIAIREESHAAIDYIHQALGSVVTIGIDTPVALKQSQEVKEHPNPLELPYDDLYAEIEQHGFSYVMFRKEEESRLAQHKMMAESPFVDYFSYSLKPYAVFEAPDLEPTGSHHVSIAPDEPRYLNFRGINRLPLIDTELSNAIIHQGRQFTEEELEDGPLVCIISKELAELNHLRIGDSVTGLVIPELVERRSSTNFSVELEIIGMIDYQREVVKLHEHLDTSADLYNLETFTYNTVIIPNQLVMKLQDKIYDIQMKESYPETFPPQKFPYVQDQAFVIKDPKDIPAFKESVSHLQIEGETFYDNRYRFDTLASPLEQTLSLADQTLLFSALAGMLIITLILFLFLRERRHEIGILPSLGVKKPGIVIQLLTEVLLITLLALSITVVTGHQIATMITESSIKEELTYSDTSMFDEDFRHEQFFSEEFGRFISADEVRENYQVGFTPAYMLKLTLGGLFTSTLATIISSYYIFILSPRKILLQ